MKISATFTHAIVYCGDEIVSLHTNEEEAVRLCKHCNDDDMQSDYYKVHLIDGKLPKVTIER